MDFCSPGKSCSSSGSSSGVTVEVLEEDVVAAADDPARPFPASSSRIHCSVTTLLDEAAWTTSSQPLAQVQEAPPPRPPPHCLSSITASCVGTCEDDADEDDAPPWERRCARSARALLRGQRPRARVPAEAASAVRATAS